MFQEKIPFAIINTTIQINPLMRKKKKPAHPKRFAHVLKLLRPVLLTGQVSSAGCSLLMVLICFIEWEQLSCSLCRLQISENFGYFKNREQLR